MNRILIILAVCFSTLAYAEENNYNDITEKLFLVHATNILPNEGVIRAGFRQNPFSDPLATNLYPNIRDTVHFAIGEVVRPIKVGDAIYSWNDSPYAIVMPLKNHLSQLVNLNCYDAFTLGTVNMDLEDTTVIVPEKTAPSLPEKHKYTIWTYDPKVKKIREAVDDVIRHKKGWVVRMLDNHCEDDLSQACIEGTNADINHSEFFKCIKEEHPHISVVGIRWKPFEGESYLFGVSELVTMPVIKYLLSGTFEMAQQAGPVVEYTTEQLEEALHEMKATAEKIDRLVMTIPAAKDINVLVEYEDKRYAWETWMNIVRVEIELNDSINKTLRGASPDVWDVVDAVRGSIDDLRSELFDMSDELCDCAVPVNK